mmetsp:Transcript_66954/g.160357  ORF Transcript_66954/g.160357 Transcript_66954/m.160357 type:complete len:80 (+) Transcript_66954:111-350(+)
MFTERRWRLFSGLQDGLATNTQEVLAATRVCAKCHSVITEGNSKKQARVRAAGYSLRSSPVHYSRSHACNKCFAAEAIL